MSLPGNETARIPVHESGRGGDGAFCEVIKDAGDDPDITNGACIRATITLRETDEIIIAAGAGVGMVTRPGLAVAPGKPAINPVPERMICASVQGGAARRAGGSRDHQRSRRGRAGKKNPEPAARHQWGAFPYSGPRGWSFPILTRHTGTQSCALLMCCGHGAFTARCCAPAVQARRRRSASTIRFRKRPLFSWRIIFLLPCRKQHGMDWRAIIIAGFPGKLLKMAAGAECTHYRKADIDLSLLADLARRAGMTEHDAHGISRAHTARHAMEFIPPQFLRGVCAQLAGMVKKRVREIGGPSLVAEVLLLSYNGGVLFHEKNH